MIWISPRRSSFSHQMICGLLCCPFGLVVIDFDRREVLTPAVQARLRAAVRTHHSALLCLTRKSDERPSLGPLVALRASASRQSQPQEARFSCSVRIIKNKGPSTSSLCSGYAAAGRAGEACEEEVCHGPAGLR